MGTQVTHILSHNTVISISFLFCGWFFLFVCLGCFWLFLFFFFSFIFLFFTSSVYVGNL